MYDKLEYIDIFSILFWTETCFLNYWWSAASPGRISEFAMSATALFTCVSGSHPFQERHINLSDPAKIGRSVAQARPNSNNTIFDCKVLSRNHALLWYEGGKVRNYNNIHFKVESISVNLWRFVTVCKCIYKIILLQNATEFIKINKSHDLFWRIVLCLKNTEYEFGQLLFVHVAEKALFITSPFLKETHVSYSFCT